MRTWRGTWEPWRCFRKWGAVNWSKFANSWTNSWTGGQRPSSDPKIDRDTILQMPPENSGRRKSFTKLVPRSLTREQKKQSRLLKTSSRLARTAKLLEASLGCSITITKQNIRASRGEQNNLRSFSCWIRGSKRRWSLFFNKKGLIHSEHVAGGKKVNSMYNFENEAAISREREFGSLRTTVALLICHDN
jgi:hypothetical protein